MAQEDDYYCYSYFSTQTKVFTLKEFCKYLDGVNEKLSLSEARKCLESNPLVFPLQNGYYITRAGAFTGRYFSIKPSAFEINEGVFIPGDRCMPFIDSESFSGDLKFVFENKVLPRKPIEIESDRAIDLFMLYGEEYAPQYIAADPANNTFDLFEKDFVLPNTVWLTAVDFSSVKEKYGFTISDRFLCRVTDWSEGIIELKLVHEASEGNVFDKGEAGDRRLHWYSTLEKLMLQNFDRAGPCSSIEEQLAVLFVENRSVLCVEDCGSVHEFINSYAKKVGIENFGVETRLWHKGKNVPAVGSWNKKLVVEKDNVSKVLSPEEKLFYSMPQFIKDQFILDMFYRRSEDLDALLERMLPESIKLNIVEKNFLLLHLQERSVILQGDYNWFADQSFGPVRQKALLLYMRIALLVNKVDGYGKALENFPQQELVILSQLFNHLTRILESVSDHVFYTEETDTLLLSLDGMEMNFEEIRAELEDAVVQERKRNFTVIK